MKSKHNMIFRYFMALYILLKKFIALSLISYFPIFKSAKKEK